MRLVKNGCPVCEGDVKGDAEHKYYCKHCNVLYEEHQIREKPDEEPRPSKPAIEFLDNEEGKIVLTGIEREKGYLYFIDKRGDVSRVKMARSRADKGPKLHERILEVGLNKEKGYLYYMDKEGDIARSPMKRG